MDCSEKAFDFSLVRAEIAGNLSMNTGNADESPGVDNGNLHLSIISHARPFSSAATGDGWQVHCCVKLTKSVFADVLRH